MGRRGQSIPIGPDSVSCPSSAIAKIFGLEVFTAASMEVKLPAPPADNYSMASGAWKVKKNGEGVSILNADSGLVASLPAHNGNHQGLVRTGYLIAAAPQLLEVCTRLKEILENSLVVTPEGYKIDCSGIRQDLLSALLRAKGARKSPGEP